MKQPPSPFEVNTDEARRVQDAYGADFEAARLVLALMDHLCQVEVGDTFFTSLGEQVRSWLDSPQYKVPLSRKQMKVLENEGF